MLPETKFNELLLKKQNILLNFEKEISESWEGRMNKIHENNKHSKNVFAIRNSKRSFQYKKI